MCSSPSYIDTPPPSPKISTATIRLQKYSSRPCPKGCSCEASFLLRSMPTSSSASFAVSTTEWMPSDSIDALPVMPATMNFVAAIATFAAIAPYTASRDSAMAGLQARRSRGGRTQRQRGGDRAHVAEGQREVANGAAGAHVEFLGVQ